MTSASSPCCLKIPDSSPIQPMTKPGAKDGYPMRIFWPCADATLAMAMLQRKATTRRETRVAANLVFDLSSAGRKQKRFLIIAKICRRLSRVFSIIGGLFVSSDCPFVDTRDVPVLEATQFSV